MSAPRHGRRGPGFRPSAPGPEDGYGPVTYGRTAPAPAHPPGAGRAATPGTSPGTPPGTAPGGASPPAEPPRARADSGRPGHIRRRRWSAGQLPFRLELPPVGLVLGLDGDGMSAAFPLLLPTQSTRVGIVGERSLVLLLALRLLSQSCDLTVVTNRRDEWQRLATGSPDTPFAISPTLHRWPPPGTPPPWALIVDMDDPPPTGFTRAPWSTVVHFAATVPAGSGWWQSAHLLLTTRAHVRSVAALRPRVDATALDDLADDDVVAVDQSGVTVFRPSVNQREYGLLSGLGQPPGKP